MNEPKQQTATGGQSITVQNPLFKGNTPPEQPDQIPIGEMRNSEGKTIEERKEQIHQAEQKRALMELRQHNSMLAERVMSYPELPDGFEHMIAAVLTHHGCTRIIISLMSAAVDRSKQAHARNDAIDIARWTTVSRILSQTADQLTESESYA